MSEEVVRAQLEAIAERLDEGTIGFDRDMAMATAALARAAVGFETERRQLARQRRRALALYSIDEIVAHIKTLDDRKRSFVIDQLSTDGDEDDLDDEDDDDRPEAH